MEGRIVKNSKTPRLAVNCYTMVIKDNEGRAISTFLFVAKRLRNQGKSNVGTHCNMSTNNCRTQ